MGKKKVTATVKDPEPQAESMQQFLIRQFQQIDSNFKAIEKRLNTTEVALSQHSQALAAQAIFKASGKEKQKAVNPGIGGVLEFVQKNPKLISSVVDLISGWFSSSEPKSQSNPDLENYRKFQKGMMDAQIRLMNAKIENLDLANKVARDRHESDFY
jgi:hypothetical protein